MELSKSKKGGKMMHRKEKKEHEARSKNRQLLFSFSADAKNEKPNNVVHIDTMHRGNEKSLKKSLHQKILRRFLRHSEELDW